jgi:hypothetical protein
MITRERVLIVARALGLAVAFLAGAASNIFLHTNIGGGVIVLVVAIFFMWLIPKR